MKVVEISTRPDRFVAWYVVGVCFVEIHVVWYLAVNDRTMLHCSYLIASGLTAVLAGIIAWSFWSLRKANAVNREVVTDDSGKRLAPSGLIWSDQWLVKRVRACLGDEAHLVVVGRVDPAVLVPKRDLVDPYVFTPSRTLLPGLVWAAAVWGAWLAIPWLGPNAEMLVYRDILFWIAAGSTVAVVAHRLWCACVQVWVYPGKVEVRYYSFFGVEPRRTKTFNTKDPKTVFVIHTGQRQGGFGIGERPSVLASAPGRDVSFSLHAASIEEVVKRLLSKAEPPAFA